MHDPLHPPSSDRCKAVGSIDSVGAHTLSALPFPSPASISPAAAAAAAAEALSQVDGSRHSLTEPPCPPLTPLIHLYTLYTDLERRGQIKKDRFPVSSLLLMSLLLSHLLSLFFCWLKFDFHHPSPASCLLLLLLLLTSPTPSPIHKPFLSSRFLISEVLWGKRQEWFGKFMWVIVLFFLSFI